VNSPTSDLFLGLLKGLGALLILLVGLLLMPFFYLLEYFYPNWQTIAFLQTVALSIGILIATLIGADFTILHFEIIAKAKKIKSDLSIAEEQKRIEKEIERRKNIVFEILVNLYKETEKEVNKTLIPTLINELYDIYIGLHSNNMNDLIINGSLTDFQDIAKSIISELNRLKELAIDAQSKGYTYNNRENAQPEEKNGDITKEQALKILGLSQNATKEEIKKAYRRLSKKYHEDKNLTSEGDTKKKHEEKMKDLNSAKQCLQKLGLYD